MLRRVPAALRRQRRRERRKSLHRKTKKQKRENCRWRSRPRSQKLRASRKCVSRRSPNDTRHFGERDLFAFRICLCVCEWLLSLAQPEFLKEAPIGNSVTGALKYLQSKGEKRETRQNQSKGRAQGCCGEARVSAFKEALLGVFSGMQTFFRWIKSGVDEAATWSSPCTNPSILPKSNSTTATPSETSW